MEITIGLGQAERLDHFAGLMPRLFCADSGFGFLCRDGGLAPGGFGAHRFQLVQAAHISCPAPGDAALKPVFFGFELGLQLLQLADLGLFDFFGPALEIAVAFRAFQNDAVAQPERVRGHILHKPAVVADQKDGAVETEEPRFQGLDHWHIEMVGWLVQKQDVRGQRERLGEGGAADLTTRENGRRHARVNAEMSELRFGLPGLGAT